MICGSGGSKSRLAKAAGAEPSGQIRHASKLKCTSHTILGPRLEVEKFTPEWYEAYFQVWSVKPDCRGPLSNSGSWDVEKACAVVKRSTFPIMLKAPHGTSFLFSDVVSRGRRKGFGILPKVGKLWRFCGNSNRNNHYITLHYITLHCNSLHYITLHIITLHYTALHHTTLQSATLHYENKYNYNYTNGITLHKLYFITYLHCITRIGLHYTTLTTTTTTRH